ncbi:hypothetical protein BGX21_002820 [Mortierella sp. AD011]|nr:hypothetical protein BGX20_003038 [Mortierella sp. AD010]KAF9401052.1 hypothetical protein BGX21_002820 [Mortierella sp. AD011]
MPKRKAVTNATATNKANNVNTLKKSASSAKGSSVDKRLTQTFGAKSRKTVIIEDDSDDGIVDRGRGATLVHTAKPLKRARYDRHNVDSDGDKQRTAPTTPPREEIDRPFEERMPGIVLVF